MFLSLSLSRASLLVLVVPFEEDGTRDVGRRKSDYSHKSARKTRIINHWSGEIHTTGHVVLIVVDRRGIFTC